MRCVFCLALLFASCQPYPETPLTQAAANGSADQVKRALQNASPEDVQVALFSASRTGNAVAIPLLVKAGADPRATWGVKGWTPLEHAVHKRQVNSVKALLDAGAPIDQKDSHQRTALRWAAGNGFTEIVQLLLDRGADPRIADEDGINALDSAIFGLIDIDNFTAGKCQTDTVRAILAKAPDLKPGQKASRIAVNLKNCGEIQQLIAVKH